MSAKRRRCIPLHFFNFRPMKMELQLFKPCPQNKSFNKATSMTKAEAFKYTVKFKSPAHPLFYFYLFIFKYGNSTSIYKNWSINIKFMNNII